MTIQRRSTHELVSKLVSGAGKQRQKSWLFEQLEARHLMTADPLTDPLAALEEDGAAVTASASAVIIDGVLPNDPLVPWQWHIFNTSAVSLGDPLLQPLYGVPGEDANVLGAWEQGYTGQGVVVAVVDTGVQLTHPDLVNNLHPFLAYDSIVDVDKDSSANAGRPRTFLDPTLAHGTAVAGIIAATGNNGIGGVGIAYNASIVPIRAIDESLTTENAITNALKFGLTDDPATPYDDVIDIYNHGWSPVSETRAAVLADPLVLLELQRSAVEGRNGLGAINIFAAGNDASASNWGGLWGFAGYNPYLTKDVIAVTGVDHDGAGPNPDGTFTDYPEIGPNVLVAAPTGNNTLTIGQNPILYGSGIWTTDFFVNDPTNELQQFQEGYNASPANGYDDYALDFLEDTDYTSRFNGTSAAAAVVSGVVALMLEANPNLTFRDVQEILVRSARQNATDQVLDTSPHASTKSTWITNSQELFHIPDAYNASNHDRTEVREEEPEEEGEDPIEVTYIINDGYLGSDTVTPYIWNPILDPWEVSPDLYTNGAGYTVSMGQGRLGSLTGYGHGVVDAELAVKMAKQWTTSGQTLQPQQTWTAGRTFTPDDFEEIPAASVSNMATDYLVVPGRLGSPAGAAYYNEYGGDLNFSGNMAPEPPTSGYISIFPGQTADSLQTVEWVEVKLGLSTGDIDNLRITLVSPSGVHSDLNQYFDTAADGENTNPQYEQLDNLGGDPGVDINPDGGEFNWTFWTNRHWGERSDSAYLEDPATGQNVGTAGWRLYFENFGSNAITLNDYELVFHGSPIEVGSVRIQGLVGVDDNNDSRFNFERYLQYYTDLGFGGQLYDPYTGSAVEFEQPGPMDPPLPTVNLGSVSAESYVSGQLQFNRLGEVERFADPSQESFAENVLVQLWGVRGNGSELLVDQFLTGDDGNYYFDVTPPYAGSTDIVEYKVRIVDGEAREVVDDPNTPEGYLAKYKSEWTLTSEYFNGWQHDRAPSFVYDEVGAIVVDEATGAPLVTGNWSWDPLYDYDVLVNPETGVPLPGGGGGHVRGINFLVTEGDPPPQQIEFNGLVFSDSNEDGAFNASDVGKGDVRVFHDANRNGAYDSGEQFVTTSDGTDGFDQGSYSLIIASSQLQSVQIGVQLPGGFTYVAPSDGVIAGFGEPGDVFDDADFALKPMVGSGQGGQPSIQGVAYEDLNENGARQSYEPGVGGASVYLDLNNDGDLDENEPFKLTNSGGAFEFSNLGPGSYTVRLEDGLPYSISQPTSGNSYTVVVADGGAATGLSFGLISLLGRDYGDLAGFPTIVAEGEDGPSHRIVNGVRLGAEIDGELNGQASVDADGDDNDTLSDEDGVVPMFGPDEVIGDFEEFGFTITTAGTGYFLNAWIDFNGDGDWDDEGEHVYNDIDLNPGTWVAGVTLDSGGHVALPTITAPNVKEGAKLAARFRWGEGGLGYTGPANVGEVEDYYYVASLIPAEIPVGDYSRNGTVGQEDYDVWRASYGQTGQDLAADGNGDGVVNASDYTVWRNAWGTQTEAGAPEASTFAPASASNNVLDTWTAAQVRYNTQLAAAGKIDVTAVPGYEVRYEQVGSGQSARMIPVYAPISSTGATSPSVTEPVAQPTPVVAQPTPVEESPVAVSDPVVRRGWWAESPARPGKALGTRFVVGVDRNDVAAAAHAIRASQLDLFFADHNGARDRDDEDFEPRARDTDDAESDDEALALALAEGEFED